MVSVTCKTPWCLCCCFPECAALGSIGIDAKTAFSYALTHWSCTRTINYVGRLLKPLYVFVLDQKSNIPIPNKQPINTKVFRFRSSGARALIATQTPHSQHCILPRKRFLLYSHRGRVPPPIHQHRDKPIVKVTQHEGGETLSFPPAGKQLTCEQVFILTSNTTWLSANKSNSCPLMHTAQLRNRSR